VGTDIYGVIEVRDPGADADSGTPWVRGIDLYPLYAGNDYSAFGCLFGVRNWVGWDPVAGGRGLPADVSQEMFEEYEHATAIDAAIHGSTWVSWPELRDLDMTVRPAARGVLTVRPSPHETWQYRVDDHWPDHLVAQIAASPVDTPFGTWQHGETLFEYQGVSRLDVLGPGTGWEHVFTVMRALTHRFGEDGVRIIAWFD
jgi:hypothetical protein